MERLINRGRSKSYIDNSIVCDKCHKWIRYSDYFGYSHRCSGLAKGIYGAAHMRFCSVNSFHNRDAQIFGMHDIVSDLDSVSMMYDPAANKPSRKDVEMNNSKREQVKQLVMAIDYAEERILYFERLKRDDDYVIVIEHKPNDRPPEIIKNGYEIINQIIHSYKQSLENYNKELDELLAPDTIGSEQYVPPKDKRWFWGKGA